MVWCWFRIVSKGVVSDFPLPRKGQMGVWSRYYDYDSLNSAAIVGKADATMVVSRAWSKNGAKRPSTIFQRYMRLRFFSAISSGVGGLEWLSGLFNLGARVLAVDEDWLLGSAMMSSWSSTPWCRPSRGSGSSCFWALCSLYFRLPYLIARSIVLFVVCMKLPTLTKLV